MMNHEKITPFVCFGWGCDFAVDKEETKTYLYDMSDTFHVN